MPPQKNFVYYRLLLNKRYFTSAAAPRTALIRADARVVNMCHRCACPLFRPPIILSDLPSIIEGFRNGLGVVAGAAR